MAFSKKPSNRSLSQLNPFESIVWVGWSVKWELLTNIELSCKHSHYYSNILPSRVHFQFSQKLIRCANDQLLLRLSTHEHRACHVLTERSTCCECALIVHNPIRPPAWTSLYRSNRECSIFLDGKVTTELIKNWQVMSYIGLHKYKESPY